MTDDKVGYGKPPKHTQFGQPGGPASGKTSKQKKAEYKAATIATQLRLEILRELRAKFKEEGSSALAHLDPVTLKLFSDAENRGLGAPKQTVEAAVTGAPKGLGSFYGEGDKDE